MDIKVAADYLREALAGKIHPMVAKTFVDEFIRVMQKNEDEFILDNGGENEARAQEISEAMAYGTPMKMATYLGAMKMARWKDKQFEGKEIEARQQAIQDAVEYMNKNFTFIHPRKGIGISFVNVPKFIEAMNELEKSRKNGKE